MKEPADLFIDDVRLVLPGRDEPVPGALRVEQGLIAAAGDIASPDGMPHIAGNGRICAPGIVDMGVFATDKPAFRFGGITRAALMPDQSPVLDDPATVRFTALKGKPDFWLHPLAAATKGLAGGDMAEIALMKDAGARGVATGRRWIADSGLMLKIMRYCAAHDLLLVVHSEDDGLAGRAVATAGEMATRLGLPAAPPEAEALAVARDLMLADLAGVRLHFRQLTTARALDLVRAAKAKGLPISAGITPAHLFLSDLAIGDYRSFCRLSPPLRCEDDRLAAIAAVRDGTIDVIASGHDPRGPEDKRLPFADAEPGMAGAETLLAMGLQLVRDSVLSLPALFERLAARPAELLGVAAGRIAEGMEADLILVDPHAPWQVDRRRMEAQAGNTPFDGLPVQGRVLSVIKGGRPIA